MSFTAIEPKFNPNEGLTLTHRCLVLDRNILDCREYLFGEVYFDQLSIWIEFIESDWPFNLDETYFQKELPSVIENAPIKYRITHKYSYRGIKFVMRLDEVNFVVCGSRKDVQIRFQDNIGAENFVDTLAAYQVVSKLVWNKVFEAPQDRPIETKDQDPNVPKRVREDFETLSAVSRLIGNDSWSRYVSTQRALQKDVLTYWVNIRHHQNSLGPQVGLAKDLVMDKENYKMVLKIGKIIKRDLEANIETMRKELDDYEAELDTLLANFKKVHPIYNEATRWTATEREVRFVKVPFTNTRGTHSLSDLKRVNAQNQRVEVEEVKEEDDYDENEANNYDWSKAF